MQNALGRYIFICCSSGYMDSVGVKPKLITLSQRVPSIFPEISRYNAAAFRLEKKGQSGCKERWPHNQADLKHLCFR